MEWDPDIRGQVVRSGWNAWLPENRDRLFTYIHLEIPRLSGDTAKSLTSYMRPGGEHGTSELVFETESPGSRAHDGRGPVHAKPGGVLRWLAGLSGGFLDIVPPGTEVKFKRVKGAKADPWFVRGLRRGGLTVKGWRPHPNAPGVKGLD